MQELEGNAADITGADDFGPSVSTEKVPFVAVYSEPQKVGT